MLSGSELLTQALFLSRSPKQNQLQRNHTGLEFDEGEIGTIGFVGIDAFEISGNNIVLGMNRSAGGTLVDFSNETGIPLTVSDYGFIYEMDRATLRFWFYPALSDSMPSVD